MRSISVSGGSASRRGPGRACWRLLACCALAAFAVMAWAAPVAAKGPMPAAPELSGPLISGEATEVVVRLEWPGGEIPAGFGPESYDMWGDDLPWDLLAVRGNTASTGAMADVEHLALSNQGGGRYTGTFTPTTPGNWSLVMAIDDGIGRWHALQTQLVDVADPHVANPDNGSPTAAVVGLPAFAVVAALSGGAVLLWRRRRACAVDR
jgi:hypothetical protein